MDNSKPIQPLGQIIKEGDNPRPQTSLENIKKVMEKWTPEYVEYVTQKYSEQDDEESVWLSCLEQSINIFLNDEDVVETSIEFDTLQNFEKSFEKFGFKHRIDHYDQMGWELEFDTDFINEDEQVIVLRGSWMYGNFKLMKLWKR